MCPVCPDSFPLALPRFWALPTQNLHNIVPPSSDFSAMKYMKKYFALLPIIWFFVFSGPEKGFGQGGCQINLGILTPNVCVGSQVCIPFTLTNCTGSGQISLELSGPLPSAASACTFNNIVLSTTGACLTVPQNFQQGTYCVRLKRGSIVSEAKRFFIDTIDRSPAPQIPIVQLPTNRTSPCKASTLPF